MIVATTRAAALAKSSRIDARYFSAPAVQIKSLLAVSPGVSLRRIGHSGGFANVWAPSRFKRTYATDSEPFAPYLRPYDVFEFLPPEADRLSIDRTPRVDDYRIVAGDLLQTCSGRNLGPLTIADGYLSRFALSHDMIRIRIANVDDRHYTLAFLRSPTGQQLLRSDLNGSVIDHISVDQVASIEVPFMTRIFDRVAATVAKAIALREAARIQLHSLIAEYQSSLPQPNEDIPRSSGWTYRAGALGGRLDAAFHDPVVASTRAAMTDIGGVRVGDVADTFIPGRYKRYYVDAAHGRPIVSGRQLLQTQPINLSYIAPRSFDSSAYELTEGMIAFGAEGRAEERIAQPALITSERASWLANNHVMRVRPRRGVHPGWLYLAFAIAQVQAQVKACSCGSVVDAVNPPDLNKVILPPFDESRGELALRCWLDLSRANLIESEAVELVESSLLTEMKLAAC